MEPQLSYDSNILGEGYPFNDDNYTCALFPVDPFFTGSHTIEPLGSLSSLHSTNPLDYEKQLSVCSALLSKPLPNPSTISIQTYAINQGKFGNQSSEAAQEHPLMGSGYVEGLHMQADQLLAQHKDPMLAALAINYGSVNLLASSPELQDVTAKSLRLSPYADLTAPIQYHSERTINTRTDAKTNTGLPTTPYNLTTRPFQFNYGAAMVDVDTLGCLGENSFDDTPALLPPFGI